MYLGEPWWSAWGICADISKNNELLDLDVLVEDNLIRTTQESKLPATYKDHVKNV